QMMANWFALLRLPSNPDCATILRSTHTQKCVGRHMTPRQRTVVVVASADNIITITSTSTTNNDTTTNQVVLAAMCSGRCVVGSRGESCMTRVVPVRSRNGRQGVPRICRVGSALGSAQMQHTTLHQPTFRFGARKHGRDEYKMR